MTLLEALLHALWSVFAFILRLTGEWLSETVIAEGISSLFERPRHSRPHRIKPGKPAA